MTVFYAVAEYLYVERNAEILQFTYASFGFYPDSQCISVGNILVDGLAYGFNPFSFKVAAAYRQEFRSGFLVACIDCHGCRLSDCCAKLIGDGLNLGTLESNFAGLCRRHVLGYVVDVFY